MVFAPSFPHFFTSMMFNDKLLEFYWKLINIHTNSIQIESLGAGLLSTGLQLGDRILICGSNTSLFLISTLACARAGLIFSLMNSNIPTSEQLKYVLEKVLNIKLNKNVKNEWKFQKYGKWKELCS